MRESTPIACSLDGNAARRRWAEWGTVMAARLFVDLQPERLTVGFTQSVYLSTRLGELVVAERQCCGFVDWELQDRRDELSLIVRGNPDGVLAIAESFGVLQ
jgi:hypothetical protein